MIGSDSNLDNYVDDAASVGKMRARLPNCHGGTISWTTARYSSNEITFNGKFTVIVRSALADRGQERELRYLECQVLRRELFELYSIIRS